MVAAQHEWRVVGPWYRWKPGQTQVRPTDGRGERPAIQKYDTSDLVNRFLEDPQRSLRFGDEDRVQQIGTLTFPFTVLGSALPTKAALAVDIRKLFLETHKRFYLVTCEVRCETTGFPKVKRDEIAEAGFVIRRRRKGIPRAARPAVDKLSAALRKARVQSLAADRAALQARTGLPEALASGAGEPLDRAQQQARAKVDDLQTQLGATLQQYDAPNALEGWRRTEFEGVGEWVGVDEKPDAVEEVVHPLQPLIPDPRDRDHDGARGTIYFGLLPVSGADVDATGAARFDTHHDYEVRCFVRRVKKHLKDCPPLVWSPPTERYRIASHNDLAGVSNHRVSVQLPDLNELEAQADALPPGKAASFRMISPPESSLSFTPPTDGSLPKDGGSRGGAEICSFAIPLITIVALFLLQLILPIVVFLFQLFFLLKLKFCIPPSASLSADVAAAIDLQGEAGIHGEILTAVNAAIEKGLEGGPEILDRLDEAPRPLSKLERAKIAVAMSTDYSQSLPPGTPAEPSDNPNPIERPLPDLTAGLEYEPRKEMIQP